MVTPPPPKITFDLKAFTVTPVRSNSCSDSPVVPCQFSSFSLSLTYHQVCSKIRQGRKLWLSGIFLSLLFVPQKGTH